MRQEVRIHDSPSFMCYELVCGIKECLQRYFLHLNILNSFKSTLIMQFILITVFSSSHYIHRNYVWQSYSQDPHPQESKIALIFVVRSVFCSNNHSKIDNHSVPVILMLNNILSFKYSVLLTTMNLEISNLSWNK